MGIIIDSSYDDCMLEGGMGRRIASSYFDDSLTDEGNVNSDRIKIVEDDFNVGNPYPNPFSSTSSIIFPVFCSQDQDVSLVIYNILGERIATLTDSKHLKGDERYFIWDGMTTHGDPAPSGVYIYKVVMGERSKAKKMMYIRR